MNLTEIFGNVFNWNQVNTNFKENDHNIQKKWLQFKMIPGGYGLNYILFPRNKTSAGKKISREVIKAKLWWSMTIIQWISSWFDTWYKFQQKKNKSKSHWKQNMVVKMIKKVENKTRVIIYFQVLSKIIIMIEKFFPFNIVHFTFLFHTKMRMLLSQKKAIVW